MGLASFALAAFTFFSFVRIVSYVPQILKIAADTNGASAISYTTWSLWTAGHVSTALYAAVNIQDGFLAAVSVVYALCCMTVIVLTAAKRQLVQGRRQTRFDPSEIDRVAMSRWL